MLRTQVKRPSTYNIGGRTPCLKKSKFLKSDHPASVTRTSPLYPVGCGNIIRRKEFTSDSALPNVAFLLRCMFKVKQCKEDGCNQLRQQRSGGKNEKFCRFHMGAKSNVEVTAPQEDSSHPSVMCRLSRDDITKSVEYRECLDVPARDSESTDQFPRVTNLMALLAGNCFLVDGVGDEECSYIPVSQDCMPFPYSFHSIVGDGLGARELNAFTLVPSLVRILSNGMDMRDECSLSILAEKCLKAGYSHVSYNLFPTKKVEVGRKLSDIVWASRFLLDSVECSGNYGIMDALIMWLNSEQSDSALDNDRTIHVLGSISYLLCFYARMVAGRAIETSVGAIRSACFGTYDRSDHNALRDAIKVPIVLDFLQLLFKVGLYPSVKLSNDMWHHSLEFATLLNDSTVSRDKVHEYLVAMFERVFLSDRDAHECAAEVIDLVVFPNGVVSSYMLLFLAAFVGYMGKTELACPHGPLCNRLVRQTSNSNARSKNKKPPFLFVGGYVSTQSSKSQAVVSFAGDSFDLFRVHSDTFETCMSRIGLEHVFDVSLFSDAISVGSSVGEGGERVHSFNNTGDNDICASGIPPDGRMHQMLHIAKNIVNNPAVHKRSEPELRDDLVDCLNKVIKVLVEQDDDEAGVDTSCITAGERIGKTLSSLLEMRGRPHTHLNCGDVAGAGPVPDVVRNDTNFCGKFDGSVVVNEVGREVEGMVRVDMDVIECLVGLGDAEVNIDEDSSHSSVAEKLGSRSCDDLDGITSIQNDDDTKVREMNATVVENVFGSEAVVMEDFGLVGEFDVEDAANFLGEIVGEDVDLLGVLTD